MTLCVKHFARTLAHKTVLRPPAICYCSQTVYEALLGCLRLWEATTEDKWRARSMHLVRILEGIQQPDGGFDIGYDFNFGRLHKKGQATSPELVGLVALSEYAHLFDRKQAGSAAHHAAEWIRKHALDMGDGKIAIPYSPYTINEVMVYNGTSFACGALGCYLGRLGGDKDLDRIYRGMVRYLNSVLTTDKNLPGRFWYYCDQSRNDWDDGRRRKIDYYHQMQQVEMHALAQQVCPVKEQIQIIRDAADHVVALSSRHSVIPYCNVPALFKGQIHLWGLVSVVSGMLEAAIVVPQRADAYRAVARNVMAWAITHAWNGRSFEAIVTQNGAHVLPRHYMVRSDAWVFNALAATVKHLGGGEWNDIAERCYQKMEAVDFSGPESHASRKSTRLLLSLYSRCLR